MNQDVVFRFVRTLVQLLAGGAFAQVFLALTDYVGEEHKALLTGFFALLVTFAQNYLEDAGVVPAFLKPDPITVEVVMEEEARVL